MQDRTPKEGFEKGGGGTADGSSGYIEHTTKQKGRESHFFTFSLVTKNPNSAPVPRKTDGRDQLPLYIYTPDHRRRGPIPRGRLIIMGKGGGGIETTEHRLVLLAGSFFYV